MPSQTVVNLIEIITRAVQPEQVILFGSQATGAAGAESDYDFLVIVQNVGNERQVSRRIYRALLEQHIDVAVDVVVVDAEKLARHRDTPGYIYRQALREGESVYERATV